MRPPAVPKVVLVGAGGILVEAIGDARLLPPDPGWSKYFQSPCRSA